MDSMISQPLVENGKDEHMFSENSGMEKQKLEAVNMTCGTGCGFSDVGNLTKDAQARSVATRKLSTATVLCLIFITVEVVGGLFANSLAILTDAAHLLSDVAGFAISLFAIWAASWEATPRQTYGFYRLEILGALLSIQLIWLLTGILVYEAICRIFRPSEPIDGRLMFIIACFGLCCNIIMAFLLGRHGHSHGHQHHDHGHGHVQDHEHGNSKYRKGLGNTHASHLERDCSGHRYTQNTMDRQYSGDSGRHDSHEVLRVDQDIDEEPRGGSDHDNINVRGAYLHVLGDLIQSIGVMIGGAIIWAKPTWKVVDLICTLFFSVLVLGTTIRMLRDIVEILMESTPREVDATKLEKGLLAIPGVVAVHELHIWAITMGKTSLACHLRIDLDADADVILQKAIEFCGEVFSISHVTVQIERNY
eukprot:c26896_g1_i1 orf=284-1543(+)